MPRAAQFYQLYRQQTEIFAFPSVKEISSLLKTLKTAHDRRWQKKGASDSEAHEFLARSVCGAWPAIVILTIHLCSLH